MPHGHVLAAVGTAHRIDLESLLPRGARQRRRDLAQALIIARMLDPAAKLATARMLDPATASHSLGEMLGRGRVSANVLYAALDWLGSEQEFIETSLARRHLKDGALKLLAPTKPLGRTTLLSEVSRPAYRNVAHTDRRRTHTGANRHASTPNDPPANHRLETELPLTNNVNPKAAAALKGNYCGGNSPEAPFIARAQYS